MTADYVLLYGNLHCKMALLYYDQLTSYFAEMMELMPQEVDHQGALAKTKTQS